MSVFSARDFDNHQQVVFGCDPASGLRCIVAIHNTVRGPALGGCRMWNYDSDGEALADVLRLSRSMTYKSAVAGLPFGGGKAVIIGDPRTAKSEALLRAFGRFLNTLGGRYITAEDVGTTVNDMDIVRQETAYARGLPNGSGNPSPATAFGVFMAIRAAVEHRTGDDDLSGLGVAVQGLGNVGYRLCGYLAEAGARLIVADIRDQAVEQAVRDFDARAVSPEAIFEVEADVFSPCALGAVIDDDTIVRLHATIVAGGANNQLAEPRHGDELHRRGILYAPDYVANAGGVIDVASEGPGYCEKKVLERVEGIGATLKRIFARAEREHLPPCVIADRIAEEHLVPPPGPVDIAA